MAGLSRIKNFFSPNDEPDFVEDDNHTVSDFYEEEETENDEKIAQFRPRFFSSSDNSKKSEVSTSSSKETKVLIYEPKSYSEAPSMVDSLKNKKIIVLNFVNVQAEDGHSLFYCKKQIFDFVNGAVYAMGGEMKKISNDIFVVAPPEVDIDTNIRQEVEKKGATHRWAI